MSREFVIANGREVAAPLPCSIEEFLIDNKLPPRSVVVEHNGQAVAPSEFSRRRTMKPNAGRGGLERRHPLGQ